MEILQISLYAIVEWLKDLTTVQTIAAIIAAVLAAIAAYYTYKSYKDNKTGHITKMYRIKSFPPDNTEKINKKRIFRNLVIFFNLDKDNSRLRSNGRARMIGVGMPYIRNNNSRSLNNFEMRILINGVHFDHKYLDLSLIDPNLINSLGFNKRYLDPNYMNMNIGIDNIDPDFEILGDTSKGIELKYKCDVLTAKTSIKWPIKHLSLTDAIPNPEYGINLHMYYYITYDGVFKNESFIVDSTLFFDNNSRRIPIDEKIDSFLTECYYRGYFHSNIFKRILYPNDHSNKDVLVSITIHDNFVIIIKPPLFLTTKRFNKYKAKIIERLKWIQTKSLDNNVNTK